MKRTDRELTNPAEILDIIEKCDVCRIAMSSDNIPYIVPMNFGFEYTGSALTLYFHGAGQGRKIDIIAENPAVCFEMDCSHRLIVGTDGCNYSMEYESVIGNGSMSICLERNEKIRALTRLMEKYAPGKSFAFPDAVLDSVTVLKLTVTDFTGKRNIK